MLKEVSQEGTFGTKMKKQKKRINKVEKQSQAEIRVHSESTEGDEDEDAGNKNSRRQGGSSTQVKKRQLVRREKRTIQHFFTDGIYKTFYWLGSGKKLNEEFL